ncbi:hypothetical protein [Ferrovibrio sp.]|uniref:hypothetical protein n=1 Tax=Ferrovibrio sp. TaxID=1917215 RepID=UPI001B73F225|nr:hypothetical protein [Ferrovibrio sp.]MBP7064217.1 hypothetical protein [Ferrovibrio sp.]
MRLAGIALLSLLLASCGGMEDSLRDLNRNLYRGMGGSERPSAANRLSSAGSGPLTACFNAETGLLYLSQTGRCAPGYADIPATEAEKQFMRREAQQQPAQQAAAAPRSGVALDQVATIQPPDSLREAGQALCYDDAKQLIFGADFCPPGSRWIDTPEAEALQRAALEQAAWCYFAGRRLLYRSRGCRPGDQVLAVAEADRLWNQLPADRKPRQRPAGGNQPALAPVPQVQAAPRGGVDATPLPAPGR